MQSFEVTELTHVHDVYSQVDEFISNNKRHIFSLLIVNCLLKDTTEGTVNLV